MGIADIASIVSDPSTILKYFVPQKTLIGGIEVDVLREEIIDHTWDITIRPVEIGLDITDARIEQPYGVILDCIITDDILELSVGSVTSLLDGIDTWKDKRDKLYELKDKNKVITVSTPFYEYSSMLIRSIRIGRTKDDSNALFFRIEFLHVRFVASSIADIDLSQIPDSLLAKATGANDTANKAGARKRNQGSKTPDEADEKSQSILFGMFGKYLQ